MKIQLKVIELFKEIQIMSFATATKTGVPNVVAIGSQKIVNEDTIWVIDTFFKKTKENLLENNKVSISLWQNGKGYQIKGDSQYLTEGEVFEKAKSWILEKKPKKTVKGVVEIKVLEIFYLNPNYDEAGERV